MIVSAEIPYIMKNKLDIINPSTTNNIIGMKRFEI